ncbi:radical SAM protein [Pyrolobus fumarii]|nr:radical SAM protein [Pyrolobus fumarii]
MGKCLLCGREDNTISSVIGVCVECLRRRPNEALSRAMRVHSEWRSRAKLPLEPLRTGGIQCSFCVNRCVIGEGGYGYCGIVSNSGGRLVLRPGLYSEKLSMHAVVSWYLDPHPTNCVAAPVCPANTGAGYPRWTNTHGVERGMYNLAVFFAGCGLDCLYCQNWEHKTMLTRRETIVSSSRSVEELVEAAMDPSVTCVCFFGGDPTPHAPWVLRAARAIREEARRRGLVKRVCWETNGIANPAIMREMARLSLDTGGIVKIDVKAWTPSVYKALTGVDAAQRVRENVKLVAEMWLEAGKPEPPLLVTSLLLVPGYVDLEEVRGWAEYLASIDPDIPFILLAFHPDHLLRDLPPTSKEHAVKAARIAKEAGLRRVFIGNSWLLGEWYNVD